MILPTVPYATKSVYIEDMPSLTYYFDFKARRIFSRVDGLAALTQTLNKLFETERFAYVIYTAKWGVEFEGLIGENLEFVKAILESRIRDAIFVDNRVLDFVDFATEEVDKNTLAVTGTIKTIFGELGFRKEVIIA